MIDKKTSNNLNSTFEQVVIVIKNLFLENKKRRKKSKINKKAMAI